MVPFSYEAHGRVVSDTFRWLHEHQDNTAAYIEAENQNTERFFALSSVKAQLKAVEGSLIASHKDEGEPSVPEKAKGFLYYTRFEKGGNFPLFCRKAGPSAREEIFLNVNREGKGSDYVSVRSPIVSPDQKLVAFAKSLTAEEHYSGVVRAMGSQHPLSTIQSLYSMAFSADSRFLFYTVRDQLELRSFPSI